jgi:hypothetical protein
LERTREREKRTAMGRLNKRKTVNLSTARTSE